VWEGYSHAEAIAEKLLAVCGKHDVNFIYKTSFDKANRSSLKGFRGAENAIEGFRELKKKLNLINPGNWMLSTSFKSLHFYVGKLTC
jgi:3-deoxy-D-manno-octulosonic acid (KDO) 8-phosphate synthase